MRHIESEFNWQEYVPPTQKEQDDFDMMVSAGDYDHYSWDHHYPRGKNVDHKTRVVVNQGEGGKWNVIFGEHGIELPNKDALNQLHKLLGMARNL